MISFCSSSSEEGQAAVSANQSLRFRRRPREQQSPSISSSTSAPLTSENVSQDVVHGNAQDLDLEEVRENCKRLIWNEPSLTHWIPLQGLPASAASLSVADARLNHYYPSCSDNENSQRTQGHRLQAHPVIHNTTESSHSEMGVPSEEDHDGIATALSSIDLDTDGSGSNGNNDDNQDQEDDYQLSSHSSSSLPTDEESDENWESLEYIR